jgi:NAD(P)-dependent dehydrogenase (short-subunit alcohol dehydrogenase family)
MMSIIIIKLQQQGTIEMATGKTGAAPQKVALITGASGGIGLAAGVALIAAGYRVFGTSRNAAPGQILKGVQMVRCDVTDEASIAQAVAEVTSFAGRIDVLVNNAGRSLIGAAEESSPQQAQSLFDVNVFGLIKMTNAVLPIMRAQRQGRIINISSVVGFLPGPFNALYCATKHAVEGYSESLDHETRDFGVRVSLVEPVFTRTAIEENADQPDRVLNVYDKGRAATQVAWRNGVATGDPVEAVAEKIVQAATDANPSIRYTPGKMAGRLRMMRRYVPEKAFEKSFRKQMNLA